MQLREGFDPILLCKATNKYVSLYDECRLFPFILVTEKCIQFTQSGEAGKTVILLFCLDFSGSLQIKYKIDKRT